MFSRRFLSLPAWVQADHPVLRYIIQRYRGQSPAGWRAVRIFLQVVALALLVVMGYQFSTDFGSRPVGTLHDILYWPLVFLGVITGLAAMILTGNIISTEKSRGTWDTLRLTSHGAGLVFQMRWLSVFYSLRGPLMVLVVARIVFVAIILIDLARFYGGRYLDLLLSGIVPGVPVPVGALLLAATMTAGLLQPLVAVGTDAAIGLLVSVMVRNPRYDILVRAVLGTFRIGLAVLVIGIGTQVFAAPEAVSVPVGFAAILFQAVGGDQGLRLLNLEEYGLLWLDLPYSVLLGTVLLIITVVQALLIVRVIAWTARLAERAE